MQQFKVGVGSIINHPIDGKVKIVQYSEGCYFAKTTAGFNREYGQFELEDLLPEPQTVYAVCDDSEGTQPIRVFMFEDNAQEYARLNSSTPLTIRPFHLKPVNE